MELVAASTSKERAGWIGAYSQIIQKAMMIRNANSGLTPLDPSKIKVIIPYVTAEAWARIIDVYLPLYTASAISLETLLSQIPNMDVDAEMEKQAEREAKSLERFNKSNLNPDDQDNEDSEDGGTN